MRALSLDTPPPSALAEMENKVEQLGALGGEVADLVESFGVFGSGTLPYIRPQKIYFNPMGGFTLNASEGVYYDLVYKGVTYPTLQAYWKITLNSTNMPNLAISITGGTNFAKTNIPDSFPVTVYKIQNGTMSLITGRISKSGSLNFYLDETQAVSGTSYQCSFSWIGTLKA